MRSTVVHEEVFQLANVMIYIVVYDTSEESMTKVAKLFANGRSQAVRLPREFRFDGAEVFIRRDPVLRRRHPVAQAEAAGRNSSPC